MSHPGTDEPAHPLNFAQELAETERSLQALKDRHIQVQQAEQTQAQLQQRQTQIKRQSPRAASPELAAELKRIQDKLDELEFNLESRLFTWGSLKRPFWQILRFGGLGIIFGWFLALATLQNPKPQPPNSTPNPAPQSPK